MIGGTNIGRAGVFTDRVHDCLEMTLILRPLDETSGSADKTVSSRGSHYCVCFAAFASTVTS